MTSHWFSWIDSKPYAAILDGGLGSELMERGVDLSKGSMWAGSLLVDNPEELKAVAKEWLEAGAEIISTATYQCTSDLFEKEHNMDFQNAIDCMASSWEILHKTRNAFWNVIEAEKAIKGRFPKIAISFGPWSAVRPDTNEYSGQYFGLTADDFVEFHTTRANSLISKLKGLGFQGDDVVAFETIGNTMESNAISNVMSSSSLADMPYWISFQCRNDSQIASGECLSGAVLGVLERCSAKNLVAIGVNCVDIYNVPTLTSIVKSTVNDFMRLRANGGWRVGPILYPNSGEIWTGDSFEWPKGKILPPSEWIALVVSCNVDIVGGCCRVRPQLIRDLSQKLRGKETSSTGD